MPLWVELSQAPPAHPPPPLMVEQRFPSSSSQLFGVLAPLEIGNGRVLELFAALGSPRLPGGTCLMTYTYFWLSFLNQTKDFYTSMLSCPTSMLLMKTSPAPSTLLAAYFCPSLLHLKKKNHFLAGLGQVSQQAPLHLMDIWLFEG